MKLYKFTSKALKKHCDDLTTEHRLIFISEKEAMFLLPGNNPIERTLILEDVGFKTKDSFVCLANEDLPSEVILPKDVVETNPTYVLTRMIETLKFLNIKVTHSQLNQEDYLLQPWKYKLINK